MDLKDEEEKINRTRILGGGASHLIIHPVDRETGEVKRIAKFTIPKDFAQKLNKKVMGSRKTSGSPTDK